VSTAATTGSDRATPSRSARTGFCRFLGIALGGGRGKSTAVARLELGQDGRLGVAEARLRRDHRGAGRSDTVDEVKDAPANVVFHDGVLIDYLTRWVDEDTVVAIDAPLTMPPCIRCGLACPGVARCEVPAVVWMRRHGPRLRELRGRTSAAKPAVTPYTQRITDIVLAHVGLHPRETLGQGMGPLAARAAYLRRAMAPRLRLHENLIEVHPRATATRLFGSSRERKVRRGDGESVRDARKHMLASLTEGIAFDYVWPEVVVRSGRLFDAVVCAFSAFLWASADWRGPSDLLVRVPAEGPQRAQRLREAVEDVGHLWVEDGWVWTPP
jgi:predicted nuclease with RNAse H fold